MKRLTTAGLLAAAMLLTGCSAATSQPTACKAGYYLEPESHRCIPYTSATPLPTPTPTPAQVGTLANPWPPGDSLRITKDGADAYTVTVRLVAANANDLIAQANHYNDAAPAGQHYVLVEFTFTGAQDAPIDPAALSYDWQASDQDGRLYQHERVVVPGKNLSEAPELYNGQSYVGQAAYLVPDSTTALLMTEAGHYVAL